MLKIEIQKKQSFIKDFAVNLISSPYHKPDFTVKGFVCYYMMIPLLFVETWEFRLFINY